MKKYYKVFEIDKCFQTYASDTIMVGGESVRDILEHFKDIFPDFDEKVIREDWMDDDEWNDLCEYGKYKEGDIKYTPQFNDEQMKEFEESLDKNNHWSRIKEVPHLFTDIPYTYITGYGHIE